MCNELADIVVGSNCHVGEDKLDVAGTPGVPLAFGDVQVDITSLDEAFTSGTRNSIGEEAYGLTIDVVPLIVNTGDDGTLGELGRSGDELTPVGLDNVVEVDIALGNQQLIDELLDEDVSGHRHGVGLSSL